MQTDTQTAPVKAPEVPAVPAEQLERIATEAPVLPASEIDRKPGVSGATAPRAWRSSGGVD